MIKAVVIGASYGGMEAIKIILNNLPPSFVSPLMVVLHIGNNKIDTYLSQLNKNTHFRVKEADEKEKLKPGFIYFAPPNYHLQVEDKYSLSLSTDKKVNFSRPSIDVLFETAAWAFKDELLGILLTGSNDDGANGIYTINQYGGTTIVEDPETAFAKAMPRSAIKLSTPTYILPLVKISDIMVDLTKK